MAKLENATCAKCGNKFGNGPSAFKAALAHIQHEHGATRQRAQNERKLSTRKR